MADPTEDVGGTTEATSGAGETLAPIVEDTVADSGTTVETTPQETISEESFYPDPTTIPEELKPFYKGMQAAFTRKQQGLKGTADKVAAYDAFSADPRGNLTRMAKQLGLSLAEANAVAATPAAFEPSTWEEVTSHIRQDVMSQLEPILADVRGAKRNTIESQLDEAMPDWRQYEDGMTEKLEAHPTLANDPVTLLRLSVPPEVLEAKATQTAMRRLDAKAKAASVGGGGSSTVKGVEGISAIPEKMSFQESYLRAKKLAAAGKI